MDAMTLVLPVLGIAAAAAVTFYAVSFSEIREVVSALFSKSQHLFLRLSFGKKNRSLLQIWKTTNWRIKGVSRRLPARGRRGPGGRPRRRPGKENPEFIFLLKFFCRYFLDSSFFPAMYFIHSEVIWELSNACAFIFLFNGN